MSRLLFKDDVGRQQTPRPNNSSHVVSTVTVAPGMRIIDALEMARLPGRVDGWVIWLQTANRMSYILPYRERYKLLSNDDRITLKKQNKQIIITCEVATPGFEPQAGDTLAVALAAGAIPVGTSIDEVDKALNLAHREKWRVMVRGVGTTNWVYAGDMRILTEPLIAGDEVKFELRTDGGETVKNYKCAAVGSAKAAYELDDNCMPPGMSVNEAKVALDLQPSDSWTIYLDRANTPAQRLSEDQLDYRLKVGEGLTFVHGNVPYVELVCKEAPKVEPEEPEEPSSSSTHQVVPVGTTIDDALKMIGPREGSWSVTHRPAGSVAYAVQPDEFMRTLCENDVVLVADRLSNACVNIICRDEIAEVEAEEPEIDPHAETDVIVPTPVATQPHLPEERVFIFSRGMESSKMYIDTFGSIESFEKSAESLGEDHKVLFVEPTREFSRDNLGSQLQVGEALVFIGRIAKVAVKQVVTTAFDVS